MEKFLKAALLAFVLAGLYIDVAVGKLSEQTAQQAAKIEESREASTAEIKELVDAVAGFKREGMGGVFESYLEGLRTKVLEKVEADIEKRADEAAKKASPDEDIQEFIAASFRLKWLPHYLALHKQVIEKVQKVLELFKEMDALIAPEAIKAKFDTLFPATKEPAEPAPPIEKPVEAEEPAPEAEPTDEEPAEELAEEPAEEETATEEEEEIPEAPATVSAEASAKGDEGLTGEEPAETKE